MYNVLLAGVGGQGTVLASRLLAVCAANRGMDAHTAETIGMAQRGGCVTSHVRLGASETPVSPLIPEGQADLLLGFEPGEAVRALPFLKNDGSVVVGTLGVTPVTASLSGSAYRAVDMLAILDRSGFDVTRVDGEGLMAAIGNPKTYNVALLGAAAAAGKLMFTREELCRAIDMTVPERFRTLNKNVLFIGADHII